MLSYVHRIYTEEITWFLGISRTVLEAQKRAIDALPGKDIRNVDPAVEAWLDAHSTEHLEIHEGECSMCKRNKMWFVPDGEICVECWFSTRSLADELRVYGSRTPR